MSEANSSPYTTDVKYSFENYNFDEKYKFGILPKYVGSYRIGENYGLSISFEKKPNWFHRKMMKLCLGWEWRDGSPF
jgi:hypothetical protein